MQPYPISLGLFHQICPKITGIMACDPNGVIAYQHKLPWHYPDELKYYRDTIFDQIVIMGATTYREQNPSFLAHHYCIVFSQGNMTIPDNRGVVINHLAALNELKHLPRGKACYLIGGAQIASLFLTYNLLDDFLLTEITKCYPGDTFFDKKLLADWPKTTIQRTTNYDINHYVNPKIK